MPVLCIVLSGKFDVVVRKKIIMEQGVRINEMVSKETGSRATMAEI